MNQLLTVVLLFSQVLAFGQFGSPTTGSINKYGLAAYAHLSGESDFLISPISISTAMAMTYLGSEGETKKQIEKVFHFSDDENFLLGFSELFKRFKQDDPNSTLAVANRLWPGEITMTDVFKAENGYYFNTSIEPLDFSNYEVVSNTINQWVAQNTNDKITELVDAEKLPPDFVLFIVNVIYFKAGWLNEFDPDLTKKGSFTNDRGEQIEVDYMHASGKYKVFGNKVVDVLELPYSNSTFSFFVLLPKISIKELEGLFTVQNYFEWTLSTQHTSINHLQIPRFKVRYNDELKDDLISMGMPKAFEGDAEFFRMGHSPKGNIFISTVIHETFLDFNEEGTEAAAATAIGASARSMPPPPRDFIVDRPFIYLIRHNDSGTILFLGKNSNPKNEK